MRDLYLACSLAVGLVIACGGGGGSDTGTSGGSTGMTTGPTGTATTAGPGTTEPDPTTGPGATTEPAPTTGPEPTTASATTEETTDPTTDPTGDPQGGYEGFGAVTRGHEDCPDRWTEYVVDSLADDGPGTLRDAVSAGCRRISFAVGGTITLAATLNIRWSYITIDGASAPEPGITIVQPAGVATTIEAGNSSGPITDVIIHHLRMVGATTEEEGADIWGIDGEANPVSRIVIDHVTAMGGQDGIFDLWTDVDDVTLSWNLMIDTAKMMHLSTNELGVGRDRVSIHHNVFARNNERQIRIRHDSDQIDYVNNVVWGWGWFEGGAAGLHVAYDAGEVNPSLNVVGNVFHHVDGLDGDPGDAIIREQGADVGTLYFADNIVPRGEMDDQSNGAQLAIPAAAQVTTYPAATLGAMVVPLVGTHYPTDEEQALLDEIAAGI